METEKALLLVDDEAIILLSLRQELRAQLGPGYRYEIAHNAEEALEVFAELATEGVQVILVISDWLMPGMKGDEFLTRVRQDHPKVRTILVSGQTDERELNKLKTSGILDVFIRKPWDPQRLVEECSRLLALASGT